MMNEGIKALIERETQEYSERIKKNTNFNSNERIAATAAFKRGASIISEAIINQFRWRKVEEEPKVKDKEYQVLGKKSNGDYKSIWITKHLSTTNVFRYHDITEWMPIPNN